MQKVSDAPLTECPSCGKSSFKKQLTAAGFQLKGTGWYVTDFRNGSGGTSAPATGTGTAPVAEKSAASSSESGSSSTAASTTTTPSST